MKQPVVVAISRSVYFLLCLIVGFESLEKDGSFILNVSCFYKRYIFPFLMGSISVALRNVVCDETRLDLSLTDTF